LYQRVEVVPRLRNSLPVSVGDSADTARFAANAIGTWWAEMGQFRSPEATRLLVTADAGGSNGYRVRAWKAELAKLARETGLEITVCHYPPGTSKWNKIVIYTGVPGVYEVTNVPAPEPECLVRARLSTSCN
jgi:hypothetical protein